MNFEQVKEKIQAGDIAIAHFGIKRIWHYIERRGVRTISVSPKQYNKLIHGKKTVIEFNGGFTKHKTVL